MVVVPARRDERSLVAVALHLLEAENIMVERQGTVDVAHLQVDVTDVHARIDRHTVEGIAGRQAGVGISLASERASRSSIGSSCA